MAVIKQNVAFKGEYITLGQLLKKIDVIPTGGEAKNYLNVHDVLVDDVLERRRGRKLFSGMCVTVNDTAYCLVADDR